MSSWRDEAACKGVDPDFFYPEPEEARERAREALRHFFDCPVRDECVLSVSGSDPGLFGCMTPGQRKRHRIELHKRKMAS